MTAERAVEAARSRLEAIKSEEAHLLGGLSQAAASTREMPTRVVTALRALATTGALQRRWDAIVERAEATHADGGDALLAALLELLEEVAAIIGDFHAKDEAVLRDRVASLATERRTLEWLLREAGS